jgi:hypothetical protein
MAGTLEGDLHAFLLAFIGAKHLSMKRNTRFMFSIHFNRYYDVWEIETKSSEYISELGYSRIKDELPSKHLQKSPIKRRFPRSTCLSGGKR